MNPKINTFIFDFFGVICDPVIYGWYNDNRIKKGLVDENLKNVLEKFDLGQLSESDIVDYFLKYDGVDGTKEEVRQQIDAYFNVDGELIKTIEFLKKDGYKIALLSNANASFFDRKLYPLYPGFKDLFDAIVISSEVKMVKPHRDIYEHALMMLGSRPDECVFVDDSTVNVESAAALGIHGFLYTDRQGFMEYVKGLK